MLTTFPDLLRPQSVNFLCKLRLLVAAALKPEPESLSTNYPNFQLTLLDLATSTKNLKFKTPKPYKPKVVRSLSESSTGMVVFTNIHRLRSSERLPLFILHPVRAKPSKTLNPEG